VGADLIAGGMLIEYLSRNCRHVLHKHVVATGFVVSRWTSLFGGGRFDFSLGSRLARRLSATESMRMVIDGSVAAVG
jgi:hypothetical protein